MCGVGGDPCDREAVRQAALLAGSDGALELLSVVGPHRMLQRHRADRALAQAAVVARELGALPETRMVDAVDVPDAVLTTAADHDLLVVGTHERHRTGDRLLGRLESVAVRRAGRAVLVARHGPADVPFPARVLVADDGGPEAGPALRVAQRLARRHGSELIVAAPAPRALARLAGEVGASLAVVGGRRPGGRHALGNAAERLVHEAPCSVLVVRRA